MWRRVPRRRAPPLRPLGLGRTPKHPAMYASVVTKWNDTEAMSGEIVARKLREGAALIWRRTRDVQRVIRGGTS